ncbi:MAG: hypothetical protein DWQ04_10805 [Chloroflexi bacterium]|nr:MAG: hypothetical protein DWQ04_10805 [Chloroflexota bacterium]
MDDGSILMTFNRLFTLSGVGEIDDSDIVQFIPTTTGPSTAGSFNFAFDGSDVGLTSNGEDIDAIGMAPDGRFVISTVGSFSVSGVSGKDEDLLIFNSISFGPSTSGSFDLYFDGSDVGLTTRSEDVNGTWIDVTTGEIYLTTTGDFSIPAINGDRSDIFICVPSSLGSSTSCTFSLFWDGSANGFGGEKLDGFSIAK